MPTPNPWVNFTARAASFDTETHLTQQGLGAPPLVCGSIAVRHDGVSVGQLLAKTTTVDVFLKIIANPDVIIVGANIAYDMAVMAVACAMRGIDAMPLIFAAYEANRVFDIQIAAMLHDIAQGHLGCYANGQKLRDPVTRKLGRYSLSIVQDIVLHRRDAKINDRYRLSYALLEAVPIEQWDADARQYPVDDAINTLEIALAQVGETYRPPGDHLWYGDKCQHCGARAGRGSGVCVPRKYANDNLHNLSAQCYAAFAMHLGAIWGFAVDVDAVETLEARVLKSRAESIPKLVAWGFLCYDLKGTTLAQTMLDLAAGRPVQTKRETGNVKAAVVAAYDVGALAPPCRKCAGKRKVPNAKGKPVGCRVCDSSGYDLDRSSVPRTKGSKCRSCAKKRKEDPAYVCVVCAGEPEIIQGVSSGRDTLVESGDEKLIEFASSLEEKKILETYIPFLKTGLVDDDIDDEDEDEDDESET